MSTHVIGITLKTVHCPNGHLYAVPLWVDYWRVMCPMCAPIRERELTLEINELNHRVKGLKGENTKLREGQR